MVKVMSEEERLQLENELLLTCSKAQAINKYIDELEENSKLSELWCKSQQENKQLKERVAYLERSNNRREDTIMSLRSEQQLDLYKEVIEEVREYIEQHNYDYIYLDCKFIETHIYDDLLQILDKVGDIDEKKN